MPNRIKRYYIVVAEQWAQTEPQLQAIEVRYCEQVYKNNEYLLRFYKRTKTAQRKELREHGIIVTTNAETNIRKGRYPPTIRYLNYFAWYWSIPLWDMMMRDYETEGLFKGGKQ